jgi:outer membrane immunogenic protein
MKNPPLALIAVIALIGTPAFAADMAVKAPPAPVPASAPSSWTGFYIGGDLGAAWTSNTGTWTGLPSPAVFGEQPNVGKNDGSSFLGGFHAGYNYQFASTWVAGLEGDWSWTKATGSFSQNWVSTAGVVIPTAVNTLSSTLDWVSSLRLRLGYLVTPNVLAYATGGAAWARMDYAGNSFFPFVGVYSTSATPSNIQNGYAVGGGLEWAMTKNWLVRAEYLYYHFNGGPNVVAPSAAFPGFPSNFAWSSTSVSVGRLGLSYKF